MRRALLLLALAGCPGDDTGTPPTDEPSRVDAILALTGDAARGQNVFDSNCTACHPGGAQGVGPALTVAVPTFTDEELVGIVLDGANGMPTFDHLQDAAIADLLAHLRAEFD